MAPLAAAGLVALALVLTGCGSEVVRKGGEPGEDTGGMGQGGHDPSHIDPATECVRLSTNMDLLPECNEVWNTERCATDLEFALDYGCLEETLAYLRCAASSCEDVDECSSESSAFGLCRESLADTSG